MSLEIAQDLRSALDGVAAIGEVVEEASIPKSGYDGIVSDYISRYTSQSQSVYYDEQPIVKYSGNDNYDVLFGVFGSRRRNAWYLTGSSDAQFSSCSKVLKDAIDKPIPPELKNIKAPCQSEVIFKPNLFEQIPIFRLTDGDACPSITLGLVYAWDEKRGVGNCSFHRICIWPDGAVSLWIAPKRHLAGLVSRSVKAGSRLDVTVNLGVAPHVVIAACCSEPDISNAVDELAIAGAIQGSPVETVGCMTSKGRSIAHAEIVIEGSLGLETLSENNSSGSGFSIPEYLGYRRPGAVATKLHVKALTHRTKPIFQAVTGPGREQSELLGIAQEVTVLGLLKSEYSDLVSNVCCCPTGGGNLNVFLQVAKKYQGDDERGRLAGQLVAKNINCVKHVYLVDEDVNIFSPADVMWALTTRFRQDLDLIVIESCAGTIFDPTQSVEYSSVVSEGMISKCIFDCTAPIAQKKKFLRAFYSKRGGV